MFILQTSPQATAIKIRELKEQLAKCARDLSGDIQRTTRHGSQRRRDARLPTGRSKSVDRGYLTKAQPNQYSTTDMNGHAVSHHVRVVDINTDGRCKMRSSTSMQNYSFQQSVSRDYGDSLHHSTNNNNYDDATDSKSFIQQRIERLYGPGALGSAFRSRRNLLEKQKQQLQYLRDRIGQTSFPPDHQDEGRIIPIVRQTSSDEEETVPEGMPSVFRHLRPEFRHQLPVKQQPKLKRGNSADSSTQASPSHTSSPVVDADVSENGENLKERLNSLSDSKANDSQSNGHASSDIVSLSRLSDNVNREILVPIKVSNDSTKIKSNGDVPSTSKSNRDSEVLHKIVKESTSTSKENVDPSLAENRPSSSQTELKNKQESNNASQSNQTKDGHYYLKVRFFNIFYLYFNKVSQ